MTSEEARRVMQCVYESGDHIEQIPIVKALVESFPEIRETLLECALEEWEGESGWSKEEVMGWLV